MVPSLNSEVVIPQLVARVLVVAEVEAVLPAALAPKTLTLGSLLGTMTERVTSVILIPLLMSMWLPLRM